MSFVCDEQVWLKVAGQTFGRFYDDPRIHLQVQLEGKRWFCEHVFGDMQPDLPEKWHVGVQLWMEENEFFGCEVRYQEDNYAWGLPLTLGREALLHHIADIDPKANVRESSAFKMFEALRELADGMTYADRPVEIVPPGSSTHGIFTKAAEIRGLDQICLDLYEAPDFAEKLLNLVTDKTIARIRAWREMTGTDADALPSTQRWGFCDDSMQMISADMNERFVLPCHERLCAAMTTGKRWIHNCGKSEQHYSLWVNRLGITTIDGPGPFIDHGHYLEILGPDLVFNAQTNETVMASGSEADIREMMRKLLTLTAKVPGRFNITAFVMRDTPLQNVQSCYQAAKEYGIIKGKALRAGF